MAISQEQLNAIKNHQSNTKVTKIMRLNLGNFLAKYAGKSAVFDEFTNRDQVQFTLYWSNMNVSDFQVAISQNPQITRQMAKAWFDNLFKYNASGEKLIYASRRSPLPELVTYDPNSTYMITVDLMFAEGTDKDTGKPFSKYYTRIQNVLPEKNAQGEYLTFTDEDVAKIKAPESVNETTNLLDADSDNK